MNIFKNGFKQMGSLVIAAIIGVFLTVSMNVICSAVFTRNIGYNAYVYETQSSTEPVAQYEYFYVDNNGDGKDDGTDVQRKEYEEKGYIVEIQKIRSSLTGKSKTIFLMVTQIFSLIMVVAFSSDLCYKQGFKDANLVRTGHRAEDRFKGIKIGLISNLPFIILAVAMVILSLGILPEFKTVWYAFLNGYFYPLIVCIAGKSAVISDLTVVQFVLIFALQLVVPIISGTAYILGYKEINLAEKIVYKKEVE